MANEDVMGALLNTEFNQAREELRYQDNHIWGAGRFYVTSLVAILAVVLGLARLGQGPDALAESLSSNPFRAFVSAVAFIWMCFGLLLFLRIRAHSFHFKAWLAITDSIRERIVAEYKWLKVPSLLRDEHQKRSGRWSWHTWLAVLVATMNCMLAAIVVLAWYGHPVVFFLAGLALGSAPLLHVWIWWSYGAAKQPGSGASEG